jgi:hypothetical protein
MSPLAAWCLVPKALFLAAAAVLGAAVGQLGEPWKSVFEAIALGMVSLAGGHALQRVQLSVPGRLDQLVKEALAGGHALQRVQQSVDGWLDQLVKEASAAGSGRGAPAASCRAAAWPPAGSAPSPAAAAE